MKRVIRFFLVLMLAGCLAGCAAQPKVSTETNEESQEGIQIGMSFDSFIIERWQKDRDVFVATAKEYGATVNVQNANGDVETQISQIEYLISKEIDVLVVVCIDSESLSDVIDKAKEKGIKVIAYDRLIMNTDIDLYISFDNEMVGQLMAKGLLNCPLEKKKVLMLTGPTADHNVSLVEKGFRSEIEKKGVSIVDVMYADAWKPELAADYIYEHPDMLEQVDAIMCGNDSIATTTIRTLAEKRLAGKLFVVGQDAELEACQRIVEGTQVMTVYKPVERLAQVAADCACQLAQGQEISITLEQGKLGTIDNGKTDVKSFLLEPIAVTKDNMENEIINSGFHMREDVYLNMPNR